MLSFARLPLYFWADDIATACFTQNRSTINKRLLLTPYEILNKRNPNVKFFHVLNKRSRKIEETYYVTFDDKYTSRAQNKENQSAEIFPESNQTTTPLMNLYEEFMNLFDELETAKSSESNAKDNQEDELLKIKEDASIEDDRTPDPAEPTPTTAEPNPSQTPTVPDVTPTPTPYEEDSETSNSQEGSSDSLVQGENSKPVQGEGSTPAQEENILTFEGSIRFTMANFMQTSRGRMRMKIMILTHTQKFSQKSRKSLQKINPQYDPNYPLMVKWTRDHP
ncbi:hypothetical protein L1887_25607 [Cichorium endivia]|nr:hypothetical protein L1887_25607 [Cichorium endivia]